ncbi:hypothetical protein TNIN_249951 [Trichonephila inaurata madagascariensis]|uniref:Uncharacterized protein n=1 Tax=Trichonephila inaurata madagascariensis TaxID=2747483 RepID=A0A8X6XDK1_9ARAC|nr:hypothetical protein TNIN_249951 [Trichonephila inaurata madagascariensis]
MINWDGKPFDETEAGESQSKIARWPQVFCMVVSILLQQFQTSDTITKKTGQGPQRIVKPEENCCRALNARHHRGMAARQSLQTLLLRLEQW